MSLDFVKRELDLLYESCSEEGKEIQERINKQILEVLEVLYSQHHSGLTAPYIMEMIQRLWMYKPILPLTGEEDEWDGLQNKRCCSIFKDENGKAYWFEAYAYSEDGESWFSCKESRKCVEFPYDASNMKTEYRKLWFPRKYVPIKWAIKFHLYTTVKKG